MLNGCGVVPEIVEAEQLHVILLKEIMKLPCDLIRIQRNDSSLFPIYLFNYKVREINIAITGVRFRRFYDPLTFRV